MAPKVSNECLKRLHREAGWTLRQFVQAVNRVGTERGTPAKYQQPSAHQWLNGHVPKGETRPLVLEALSRRLHRPISYIDAGFPPSDDSSSGLGIVQELIELGRLDMDPSRRNVLNVGLFSVFAGIPHWQDTAERVVAVRSDGGRRIGSGEIAVIVSMTQKLSDLDYQYGGRSVRPSAAAFLVNIVAPCLSAPAHEEVRMGVLSAASDLCYLTGYMAIDEGLQGLGQRYYMKAMELAVSADDQVAYSLALHGMTSQALQLGHSGAALRLARTAAARADSIEHNARAFLAGQHAYASALTGDRKGALALLREAEAGMNRAEGSSKVVMGRYREAVMEFDTAQVKYGLKDLSGSVEALERYRELQGGGHRRRKVLDSSLLAERQLEFGHLEAACGTWNKVLDDYPFVQSGRADQKVAAIKPTLKPYVRNRVARDLYERVGSILPASGAIRRGSPRTRHTAG
ncbi:tetratricopeptide repeat protein [Streptomyces jumonjinensis]|uniref:tetratricopeptide repeat protein n=1 Tax=Streptomyces jumonjinensis TaxID=1945 RepID=UPI0037AB1BC5